MKKSQIVLHAALPLLVQALLFSAISGPLSPAVLGASSVTLAWDANSEANLVGYKIYYGSASGQYANVINVGNVTSATISNLTEAQYFFLVKAHDTEGLESDPSNEISYLPLGTAPTINQPTISQIADQTVLEDSVTSTLSFQVNDPETPAANLALSATSSNPTVVPVSNIVLGGSGNNRTVRVTPAVNQSGAALITLKVTDAAGATASTSFTLTVQEVNDPPVISALADQAILEDSGTSVLSFQVNDTETSAASLALSANSSNPTVVPVSSIVFGGAGTNRTVRVTPGVNQSGQALITLTVTDSGGASASTRFTLTVQEASNGPVISAIADQTIPQGERVGPLTFTVSDQESPPERLIVSARSSSLTLVPAANIHVSGTGNNRSITVIPRLASVGTANITVSVSNGQRTSERRFGVTVRSPSELPKSPLSVLTNGMGTVQPRLHGSNLIVGKTYTLVARPGANQLFSGWSGGVTASTNRLIFRMQSNLVLQANFVPDPFLPRKGSYNGLFYETNEVHHESSGFFALKLSPRGIFSANLKLAGRSLPFTGNFDLAGRATRTLRRPGTNAVTVDLYMDVETTQSRIRGQISDGTWDAQLLADRAISDVTTNAGIYSGRYTMSIPGDADSTSGPAGSGFGFITVNPKGSLRLFGELADGSSIVQTVPLSMDGCWPLYAPLYSGKGSVLSWISFTNTPTLSLQGLLSWIKPGRPVTRFYPNGFTNESSVFGSHFRSVVGTTNRVLDVSNAQLVLGGGNLSGTFTNRVFLVAPSQALSASPTTLKIKINPVSGILLGAFVDPGTRRIHQYRGVVLQQQRLATGYILGTNETGFVELEPVVE